MPAAEVILWSKLKGKQLGGYKFRRQCSVGSYLLDFYCPSKKIAIEVDGDNHFSRSAKRNDALRQDWIEGFGIRFLRFTNDEVRKNLDGVLMTIEAALVIKS